MPKSTQIPEVGDWVIVCSKDKHIDHLFGERLQIINIDSIMGKGFVRIENKGGNDCIKSLTIRDDEYYIVG